MEIKSVMDDQEDVEQPFSLIVVMMFHNGRSGLVVPIIIQHGVD